MPNSDTIVNENSAVLSTVAAIARPAKNAQIRRSEDHKLI